MKNEDRLLILIAPNVSEQMGGEAMKALQIFGALKKINQNTVQITHERCKHEIAESLNLADVYYVKDNWVAKILWRSKIFSKFVDVWFSAKAIQQAESIAKQFGKANKITVIHQTEPNSPVSLRKFSKLCGNVMGPINGNIYYPEIFRGDESVAAKLRRWLHFPIQYFSSLLPSSIRKVDLIFAAGGDRTIRSLAAAGYDRDSIKETVDCGIKDEILDRPRITHEKQNFRFVHYGRLVFHKGTSLAIESLKEADGRTMLDIIGQGPELENCKRLVRKLGLDERVNFLGWFASHQLLLDSLQNYRGMVLPTFEDANGIVVQEAMALGLPPICLDWGGPQLLIEDGKSGYLIAPSSRSYIISAIAERLDTLSLNPLIAETMSEKGKLAAQAWRWSFVAKQWLSSYPSD